MHRYNKVSITLPSREIITRVIECKKREKIIGNTPKKKDRNQISYTTHQKIHGKTDLHNL